MHLSLQALERAVKAVGTPLPSRLQYKVLHLEGARWLALSWELTTQRWHAQHRFLDAGEHAAPQRRWGCIRARRGQRQRALQAEGSTHLLHTALQPPLLQTHVSIELECRIGALHVEVSLQRAGEVWQRRLPARHGGQVWLLQAHVQRHGSREQALLRQQGSEGEVDRQPCCHRQHFTVGLAHAHRALELLLGIGQGCLNLVEGHMLPGLGPERQGHIQQWDCHSPGQVGVQGGAPLHQLWQRHQALSKGQIELRDTHVDILEVLSIKRSGQLEGLIRMRHVELRQPQTLGVTAHFYRGHRTPGMVRQTDQEFVHDDLLAGLGPGQRPSRLAAIDGGLHHLSDDLEL